MLIFFIVGVILLFAGLLNPAAPGGGALGFPLSLLLVLVGLMFLGFAGMSLAQFRGYARGLQEGHSARAPPYSTTPPP